MKLTEKLGLFFSKVTAYSVGTVLIILAFNFSLVANILFPQTQLKVGSIAQETIKSPKTIYFKSKIKTEEAKKRAKEEVDKEYIFDSTVSAQQDSKNDEIFARIDKARASKEDYVSLQGIVNISNEAALAIAGSTDEEWVRIKEIVRNVTQLVQDKEKIKNDDSSAAQAAIEKNIPTGLSEKELFITKELMTTVVIPNYIYSEEETNKKIESAQTEVGPVSLLIVKDEVLVNSGHTIDELDLEKLEAVGLQKENLLNQKTIGILLFSLIASFIIFIYFKYFYRSKKSVYVSNAKAFYIFSVFLILTVVAFGIIAPLKPVIVYLFPVATPIVLMAILVNAESALFSAVIFSLLLGAIFSGSVELTVIYLLTSLVGIYKSKHIKRIENIFKIGLYLAIFNFFISLSFHLLAESYSLKTLSVLLGASVVYGLSTVIIIIGTLLFWGNLFKVTTLLDLLELENPHQDLLKNLSLKAAGTYQHSIMVSNLAQKAAEDIGADVLLVRVGALYHDIGKLTNPLYFIENQKHYNVHEKLKDPEKSAGIIKDHIEEGIRIAKKEKLPKEFIHFIESHHGTSEVFYFLKKAQEEKIKIDLQKFTYPGPVPNTKEAAIIMLADSIEAKSRAESDNIDAEKIKNLVNVIINNKVTSGQLKNSPLSLRDIEILKRSFSDILGTIYHKRIKYTDGSH